MKGTIARHGYMLGLQVDEKAWLHRGKGPEDIVGSGRQKVGKTRAGIINKHSPH